MIRELYQKYKPVLMYLIFGVLATLINIVSYTFCYHVLNFSNVISNIIAWLAAVIVAFITNKLWVFSSKTYEWKVLLYELISFFGCRISTGILDLAIMYAFVDVFKYNAFIMKCISNVLVIILNYVASKLIIFRDRKAE